MSREDLALMPPVDATPGAPGVTVASLRAKIADMEKQRQGHLANANACQGAIQLAQQLIGELEGGSYA